MLKWFRWKQTTRDARAEVAAGFAAQGAGDIAEARRHYEAALRTDPANADANYLLGVLEAEAGRMDTALGLVGQAAHSEPANASFHFTRGRILSAIGRLAEAAVAHAEAARLDPAMGEAFLALGLAHLQLGDAEAA